jgi:hypothetical protein
VGQHVPPIDDRIDRYRQLTARFGKPTVLALIDRLQVLALTQPDAVREMEEFLMRAGLPLERMPSASPAHLETGKD